MKILHLALITLTALVGQTALAHTELSGSVPANHAMLDDAPTEVMLHFSEPVRLTALAVTKGDDAQKSLGPLPAELAQHFIVAAPMLSAGHYTVSWRALSEDTHVMTGEFMFMVGSAGEHAPGAALPVREHANHGEHDTAH